MRSRKLLPPLLPVPVNTARSTPLRAGSGLAVPRSSFGVPSLSRGTRVDGPWSRMRVRAGEGRGESEVMNRRPAVWMQLVEGFSLCRDAVWCGISVGGDDLSFLSLTEPLTAALGLWGAWVKSCGHPVRPPAFIQGWASEAFCSPLPSAYLACPQGHLGCRLQSISEGAS